MTDPITRAADLIAEYAEELRISSTISGDPENWLGDDAARSTYENHRALVKELMATLYAAPMPPSVPHVTEEMITAYLTANDAYWKECDKLPGSPVKWRHGTPSEATRISLEAALAAAPKPEDAAPTPPSVPDGFVLVPIEPTPEMLYAAFAADKEYSARMFGSTDAVVSVGAYDHYVAMLAAAPKPEVVDHA